MKECKTEYILGKNRLLQLYIFFYIYLSIYLHRSYNCHLTKEIQWTGQSSLNFTSWSSSGRTSFQLGEQHFILTAFLLTESKQIRKQLLLTLLVISSHQQN